MGKKSSTGRELPTRDARGRFIAKIGKKFSAEVRARLTPKAKKKGKKSETFRRPLRPGEIKREEERPIRAKITPPDKRVPPGDLEAQEAPPLSYAWAVYGLREAHTVEAMAQQGGVTIEELEGILAEYGLREPGVGSGWWSPAAARGFSGHHLRRKF